MKKTNKENNKLLLDYKRSPNRYHDNTINNNTNKQNYNNINNTNIIENTKKDNSNGKNE